MRTGRSRPEAGRERGETMGSDRRAGREGARERGGENGEGGKGRYAHVEGRGGWAGRQEQGEEDGEGGGTRRGGRGGKRKPWCL